MSYRYFSSGSVTTFRSASSIFIDDFNDYFNDMFYRASNVYTIQEETSFASGSLQNVDIRLDTAIDNLTGQKLSDDFKMLKFLPNHVAIREGYKFYFDNN